MIQPTESHSLPSHGMSCRFDSLIAPSFANFPPFPQQMFLSGLLTMTSQLLSLSSAIVMLLPEWSFWRPEANMSFPSLKCPETPPHSFQDGSLAFGKKTQPFCPQLTCWLRSYSQLCPGTVSPITLEPLCTGLSAMARVHHLFSHLTTNHNEAFGSGITSAFPPATASSSLPFSSVQFGRSVVSDSLRPHESQHVRPPCPSPTPGVHPDSRP